MSNPPTNYYIDPYIASSSGAGTIGDPYGDIQHALNTVTQNTTDGDRFNIKAGTAEVLSGTPLVLTTYGNPSFNYPLLFQGYASAQGDRGVGAINCGGGTVLTNAGNGIYWYDMEMYDGPAAGQILAISQYSIIAECYFHDSDGHGVYAAEAENAVIGCRFENLGDSTHDMINTGIGGVVVSGCYFNQPTGTRECRSAIYINQQSTTILNNIISVDGASDGIYGGRWGHRIVGNTVLSNSGTGNGIHVANSLGSLGLVLINNYVEGFGGAGGVGIEITGSSQGGGAVGQNATYNNTTNYINNNELLLELGDNEVLTASGLAKSGADTFANRFAYFEPADEGNMQTGGFPEA
jgi:hypothetical protein